VLGALFDLEPARAVRAAGHRAAPSCSESVRPSKTPMLITARAHGGRRRDPSAWGRSGCTLPRSVRPAGASTPSESTGQRRRGAVRARHAPRSTAASRPTASSPSPTFPSTTSRRSSGLAGTFNDVVIARVRQRVPQLLMARGDCRTPA
jgi:hypothetical protein